MQKKGAIEMSMQTIIVVVIGVTLLTLGLKFVYDTFRDVGSQQDTIKGLTDKQLGDLFGQSEEPISLPSETIAIKKGKTGYVDVVVRNTGNQAATFRYDVDIGDMPAGMSASEIKKWFTWAKTGHLVKPGDGYTEKLMIKVPTNAIPDTYLVSLKLSCDNEDVCSSNPFAQLIIEVQGS